MYSLSILLSHPWFGQEGIVDHSISFAFLASLNRQRKHSAAEEEEHREGDEEESTSAMFDNDMSDPRP